MEESKKSSNLRDFQGLQLNENIRASELDVAAVKYIFLEGRRATRPIVFCLKPLYINVKNMPRRSRLLWEDGRGRLGVEKRAVSTQNTKQRRTWGCIGGASLIRPSLCILTAFQARGKTSCRFLTDIVTLDRYSVHVFVAKEAELWFLEGRHIVSDVKVSNIYNIVSFWIIFELNFWSLKCVELSKLRNDIKWYLEIYIKNICIFKSSCTITHLD